MTGLVQYRAALLEIANRELKILGLILSFKTMKNREAFVTRARHMQILKEIVA